MPDDTVLLNEVAPRNLTTRGATRPARNPCRMSNTPTTSQPHHPILLQAMPDGTVLLNEVAPRPHNSGHYTMDACVTEQHEMHLRAVCGLPLGNPSLKVHTHARARTPKTTTARARTRTHPPTQKRIM